MALESPHSGRTIRLVALAVALALAGILAAAFREGLSAIDARLADLSWHLTARTDPEQRLVIIDIDEESLKELGAWPWPRQTLAAIANRLNDAGVALQAWDIVLDAPQPGDAELAAALKRGPAVLAAAFAFPGQGAAIETGHLDQASRIGGLRCRDPWPQAHGQRAPAAEFAGIPVGHIAPRVDVDGITRALPAFVCRGEAAWPTLPLAAWLALNAGQPVVIAEPGAKLSDAPWRLLSPDLPEAIPLGAAGELYVPYHRAPASFLAISARDLLAGRVPAEMLKGRIALVGSTAFGLGDVVATPLSGAQAGVLVHAELLSGLLDGRLPHPVRGNALLTILAAILAAGLLWVASVWRPQRRPLIWLPLAGLALGVFILVLQAALPAQTGLYPALTPAALAALLSGLALGGFEHLRLHGERSRLFAHLSSYLPAPVAERLVARRPEDDISAERVQASVLVADLRNFTAWSEQRNPEEVAALLHRFLAVAADVVESEGGQIEALEGDAIFAVWNGLTPCADHPLRAIRAAQTLHTIMQRELPEGDPEAVPPPLALGIGLDTGLALVGSLGPRRRRQHLVLGLPVTRAVRLAAMTVDLSAPILVGPDLAAQLPEAWRKRLLRQGEFLLEGMIAPCEIFAFNGADHGNEGAEA